MTKQKINSIIITVVCHSHAIVFSFSWLHLFTVASKSYPSRTNRPWEPSFLFDIKIGILSMLYIIRSYHYQQLVLVTMFLEMNHP